MMDKFDAPAFTQDLTPELAAGWSGVMSQWINKKITNLRRSNPTSEVAFFNEFQTPVPNGQGATAFKARTQG